MHFRGSARMRGRQRFLRADSDARASRDLLGDGELLDVAKRAPRQALPARTHARTHERTDTLKRTSVRARRRRAAASGGEVVVVGARCCNVCSPIPPPPCPSSLPLPLPPAPLALSFSLSRFPLALALASHPLFRSIRAGHPAVDGEEAVSDAQEAAAHRGHAGHELLDGPAVLPEGWGGGGSKQGSVRGQRSVRGNIARAEAQGSGGVKYVPVKKGRDMQRGRGGGHRWGARDHVMQTDSEERSVIYAGYMQVSQRLFGGGGGYRMTECMRWYGGGGGIRRRDSRELDRGGEFEAEDGGTAFAGGWRGVGDLIIAIQDHPQPDPLRTGRMLRRLGMIGGGLRNILFAGKW